MADNGVAARSAHVSGRPDISGRALRGPGGSPAVSRGWGTGPNGAPRAWFHVPRRHRLWLKTRSGDCCCFPGIGFARTPVPPHRGPYVG